MGWRVAAGADIDRVIQRVITLFAVSSAWLKVPHRKAAVVRELAAVISVSSWRGTS